jgi:hypothetical protein
MTEGIRIIFDAEEKGKAPRFFTAEVEIGSDAVTFS